MVTESVLIHISIGAFIAGSLLWILGDALIVGFRRPEPEGEHREFIAFMGDQIYAYQLSGSEPRLRAGALIANFSAPLLLLGVLAHWALVQDSVLGRVGLLAYTLGLVYVSLAHAAFYPLGEASKLAYRAFSSGRDAGVERSHARDMYRFLTWAWIPSVALILLGGVLMALTVVFGYTPFPWWAAFLMPPLLTVASAQIHRLPYPGRPALDGAAFNLANLVWGITFAVLVWRYPIGLEF